MSGSAYPSSSSAPAVSFRPYVYSPPQTKDGCKRRQNNLDYHPSPPASCLARPHSCLCLVEEGQPWPSQLTKVVVAPIPTKGDRGGGTRSRAEGAPHIRAAMLYRMWASIGKGHTTSKPRFGASSWTLASSLTLWIVVSCGML